MSLHSLLHSFTFKFSLLHKFPLGWSICLTIMNLMFCFVAEECKQDQKKKIDKKTGTSHEASNSARESGYHVVKVEEKLVRRSEVLSYCYISMIKMSPRMQFLFCHTILGGVSLGSTLYFTQREILYFVFSRFCFFAREFWNMELSVLPQVQQQ